MAHHFDMLPLKQVASINDEALSETTDPDYVLQYIDIGNVDSQGNILGIAEYRFEEAPSRARRVVRDGDVVVSTVRTYLQAIAAISKPPSNLIVSTGFAVIRPRLNRLDAGFCKYALHESRFIHEVVARSVGVSYPAINALELGKIEIVVPSLSEQRTIADFLDRETTQIDTLIARKQRLLELLAERRQALITHAVTKGLDLDAPMKDSGIEWLGEIPAHWNTEYARWLFDEIDDRSVTGDEELMSVSHITGVTPRAEKDVNMFMAETLEGYKVCRYGDLVINTLWAWMGAMGVIFQDGIVSPSYNVYRPTGHYVPRYIDYLVRMPIFAQEVTRYSKGVWSSRLRLYPEEFFTVVLPIPSLEVQKQIVDMLDIEISRLEKLRVRIEKIIERLKERRAALINEAVTGKLRVAE